MNSSELNSEAEAMLEAAKAASMTSEFVSITSAAKLLGVSVRTVRRWQAKKKMPERAKRSREKMYRRADIMAMLDVCGELHHECPRPHL
jgi:excisionase family DNA binding protein